MSFPYLASLSWKAIDTQYASTSTFHTGNLGMTEDGSLWRLCKAGAAITNTLAGKINYYQHLTGVTGSSAEAALNGAIAAGDMKYTFDDATNSRAANYYQYGYCAQPASGTNDNVHFILKSDAEVSDTYTCHIGGQFSQAYADDSTIHSYPSPWGDVRNAASYSGGYEHFVCMVNRPITSAYYFWGKVRGPHWCWVNSTWPGAASEDRDVVFHTNGTIVMADEKINTSAVSCQRAGYLMYSGNYGDALVMIQIE
jgi:hypothetical protein